MLEDDALTPAMPTTVRPPALRAMLGSRMARFVLCGLFGWNLRCLGGELGVRVRGSGGVGGWERWSETDNG